MTHDEIAELLGAYALDAVDADEARSVEAHVAACPRCAAELAEHYEMAGLLSGVGGEAPVGLWESIAASTGVARGDQYLTGSPVADLSHERAERSGRRVGWAMRVALGVAAAAVALALIAGAQINHLQGKVNQLSALSTTTGISRAVQTALLNPDTTRITLTGSSSSGKAAAVLVVQPSGQAFLVNANLASLSDKETYQLWGVIDGRAISLGVLGNDPHTVPFTLDATSSLTAFAITAERSGGVVRPTHTPVAQAAVPPGEIRST